MELLVISLTIDDELADSSLIDRPGFEPAPPGKDLINQPRVIDLVVISLTIDYELADSSLIDRLGFEPAPRGERTLART